MTSPHVTSPSPDPAIIAYLGAAVALLKFWYAESQRTAAGLRAIDDEQTHPTMLHHLQQLEAIRHTVTTLAVPTACQAAHQAFTEAMDRGLHAYRTMMEPESRDAQKVAMLSGIENFAALDVELARLERQFGPFDAE